MTRMFRIQPRAFAFATALAAVATGGSAQTSDTAPNILALEATVLDLVPTVQDMSAETQDISAEARDMVERSGEIEMREAGDDVILSVASDVLFEFDSAELSQQSQRSLSDVAALLSKATKEQVVVAGHTDAKGSNDYNLALSERRAEAVAKFLTDNGVSADTLKIEGRGEAEPVAENEIDGKDNPDGRAKNRRVEFVVPKTMLQE